jgi:hypothetical protein
VLGDLEPAVALGHETCLLERLEGRLDVLRRGPQEFGEFLRLCSVVPEVGEDAQELVEGDGLRPEVGHPADVEPGAAPRALFSPGGVSLTLSILGASIPAEGEALYA